MGELSKIHGKLEINNGIVGSNDVIQEWKDENGNIVAQLYANSSMLLANIIETIKTQGQRTEITRVDSVNIVATKSNYEFAIKSTTADVEIELLEPLIDNDGQSFAISIWNNANNIEVLAFSNILFDVDTITNTIGDTWRYTINGSFDLSDIFVGDKIKIVNSINMENNGKFVVTAVDDSNNYIEITNTNGIEELTNSSAQLQELVYYETGFVIGQYQEYKAYSVENTYLKIN